MTKSLDPFRFLLITVAGWMNQQQLQLIDYLREENRVLSEQLGEKRLSFNDDQRRRLAARAKELGSKLLREVVMSENKICLRLLGLSLAPQPGVTQCYIAKNRPLTLA